MWKSTSRTNPGDVNSDGTALLANYPNPFYPETWIPYRLPQAADVNLTIYDTKGVPVRRLDLGHQFAGDYTDRVKAAYWDGSQRKWTTSCKRDLLLQLVRRKLLRNAQDAYFEVRVSATISIAGPN